MKILNSLLFIVRFLRKDLGLSILFLCGRPVCCRLVNPDVCIPLGSDKFRERSMGIP